MLKPFAWFIPVVNDQEYAPRFRDALAVLKHSNDLLKERGLLGKDWGDPEVFSQVIKTLKDHLERLTLVHNALIEVKPRSQLFKIHKALLATLKAYGWAMRDQAMYYAALGVTGDSKKLRHHRLHGMQWDAIATGYARQLRDRLAQLREREPRMFELLLNDEQLERLSGILEPDWLRTTTGGTFAFWR